MSLTVPVKVGIERASESLEGLLRARLSWNDFIGLVSQHKDDAFELDAEVDLIDLREDCVARNSDVAKRLARGNMESHLLPFHVNTFIRFFASYQ